MLRRLACILVACSTAAACGARPLNLAAPAPADALDCTLRQLTTLGYVPIEGGISDGYIKLERLLSRSEANIAAGVATRVATAGLRGKKWAAKNVVRATGAGGTLRLQAVSVNSDNRVQSPTEEVKSDAEGVLAACAVPSQQNRVSNPSN